MILTPTHNTIDVYVDLDGVLCDFVSGVKHMFETVLPTETVDNFETRFEDSKEYRSKMWSACSNYQQLGNELWYECPLMDDAMELWEYLIPHSPQILSATGDPKYRAGHQKQRWVAEKLGDEVIVNLTRKASEKAQYASRRAILIDDKEKAIKPWRDAGGIGILHTSARDSILQLQDLGL